MASVFAEPLGHFNRATGRLDDHFDSERLSARDRFICGSVRLSSAYWRCGLEVKSVWQPTVRVQLVASVDEVVAASFSNDTTHSVISTFKLFDCQKAATQSKEITLDVLGVVGTLEVANLLFEYPIFLGVRMRCWGVLMEWSCLFTSSRWSKLETLPCNVTP